MKFKYNLERNVTLLALRAMVLKLVPEPALLETSLYMQIPRPHFRPTESGTLGQSLSICVLASLPSNADKHLRLKTAVLESHDVY